jgi:Cys-rich repeat protein
VQCGLSSDCPTGYDCSSENTCQPADAGTPPAGCSTNSDCTTAADPYCDVNTGMCVACTADIQCGTGSCISNVCTGVGPGGDAGSSERDAGTAERDAGTTAVDAGPSGVDAGRPSRDGGVPADGAVGANCTVSPDSCASGETCEALTPTTNECVAPCSRAGECPGTSICIEGEDCLAPCSTSTDCGRPDFVCDTLDTPSFCIPDCRLQASHFCILGTSCVASTGICTELPCGEQQGATTCPAGDACYLDWACSEGCTTDSDCANGFTCQGGTCSDSYNACSDAAPCDGLLDECVGGSGSTGVCLNECEDDTNCPAGQNCEDLGGTCAQSCGFGQSCPSGTTCQFVTINFTLDCLPP